MGDLGGHDARADSPPPYLAVCRDPGDDDLVALASAALVDAVVTGDRDLLELDGIGVAVINRESSWSGWPMPGRSTVSDSEDPIEQLIAGLTVEELREVVSAAVDRHGDVERQVRLIASRGAGDLAQLRAEVDRGLRTRRFLGFGESAGWACAARPIVAELEKSADESPSMALVELLQRAVGHVVKVIMHADDSDGLIGELARELLARYEFIRVAEAMRELGLHNDALAWAKRGIAHTSGWQVAQLYDLACDVHDARGAARGARATARAARADAVVFDPPRVADGRRRAWRLAARARRGGGSAAMG